MHQHLVAQNHSWNMLLCNNDVMASVVTLTMGLGVKWKLLSASSLLDKSVHSCYSSFLMLSASFTSVAPRTALA